MAKPHKVQETQAPYLASPKPAKGQAPVRYAGSKDVRETNARLMQVHRKVLEKLAK